MDMRAVAVALALVLGASGASAGGKERPTHRRTAAGPPSYDDVMAAARRAYLEGHYQRAMDLIDQLMPTTDPQALQTGALVACVARDWAKLREYTTAMGPAGAQFSKRCGDLPRRRPRSVEADPSAPRRRAR